MRAVVTLAFFAMPILIGGFGTYELVKVVMPTVGMVVGDTGQLIAASVGGGIGLIKSLSA